MNLPLITVAICCFNGERYLEKTLNSVIGQDYSNIEIVIVDDGSSDDTEKIIKLFAAENKCIRPFFRRNHGLPASRNYSFSQARGDWIAIIDQDDVWHPTRLSQQVGIAKSYPTAGLIFGNVHQIDESDEVIDDYMTVFPLPESPIPRGQAGNLLLTLGCFTASVSCLIKRETAQVVGAFNESLAYACDYDYFIRAGFEVDFAYTRVVLAGWRRHAEQATSTYKRRDHEVRSVLWRHWGSKKASVWTKLVLPMRIFRGFAGELIRRLSQ